MDTVTILMSTYNGEEFLVPQLNSLLSQEKIAFQILVRDDGSKDNTLTILKQYSERYNNFNYYSGVNIGPAKSFFDLIKNAPESDYYALCDQDDVWDSDKILCALNMLKEIDKCKPSLYYSNLRIVNKNLEFYRNAHDKSLVSTNKYTSLTENYCTGCTAVFNNILRHIVERHIPDYCSMHDAWIFMTCSLLGNVVYDFKPHISYRQHGGNVIGTPLKRNNMKLIKSKIMRLLSKDLQPRYLNACSFYSCYEGIMDNETSRKVMKIVNYKKGLKSRLELLFDPDIIPSTLYDRLRFAVHIFLGTF